MRIGREDAEVLRPCPTDLRQGRRIGRDLDRATGAQGIGDADTESARQMIVAGACLAQGRILWADATRGPAQRDPSGDLHDAFSQPRGLGAGKAVIAVAALFSTAINPTEVGRARWPLAVGG